MDYGLLVIGIALLLVSYVAAVKKQSWLLAGFNEKYKIALYPYEVTVSFINNCVGIYQ